ncbi:NUDIX domain-containing protein [Georgenia sp. Z1491]|uniref:NUDIX domain-containing protein n=1 Tax=Georgenia sp. Z1491 TaxID=3416707 RepID=UPI003CF84694
MSADLSVDGAEEVPGAGTFADAEDHRRVVRADRLLEGRIFDIVGDTVELSAGGPTVRREYLVHPGAVAIVALRGDGAGTDAGGVDAGSGDSGSGDAGSGDAGSGEPEVLLVTQYRHASRARLHEIPAGLLDVPGEDPVEAARRELAEEADLRAGTWHVLADVLLSPGATNECVRVLLARDLSEVPDAERHVREDEESEMVARWVPLADAVEAVLDGRIHNGATTAGLLAAEASRSRGWAGLRPADAPWSLRRYRSTDGSVDGALTGLPPEHRPAD